MYTSEGGEEPDWVRGERQQFFEFRDKNHDGKMDKEETMDWILPSDYDHAEAEAKHLLHESDANQVPLSPCPVTLTLRYVFTSSRVDQLCLLPATGRKTQQTGNPGQL